jgi:hypothetical protein
MKKYIFWSKETLDLIAPINEVEKNGELSLIEKDEKEVEEEELEVKKERGEL